MAADKEQLELADRLGVGLLLIESGRIRAANESAHRLLDSRPRSLVGKTTMEAFVDHNVERLVRGATAPTVVKAELTIVGEPAQTIIVRASGMDGGGTSVLLEDVSELRRLRRIRTEFIDNLSHELRTPLTTVRLLTESLAMEIDGMEVPPRVRDSITKIDVETSHLVQMVNELLDLAKIEQGEAALRLEEVDLGAVVESTLDRLRMYAERQRVALRSEVPAHSSERTVRGDPERLGQVLVNLLHNAVKFSPADSDVVVRVKAGDGEVLLEVEDHGDGIPRRELKRVFERFYKVDRARTGGAPGGGGTGLGLSIARHIVERHGGRIWAESTEGKGAQFTVALPALANSA